MYAKVDKVMGPRITCNIIIHRAGDSTIILEDNKGITFLKVGLFEYW